MATDYNTFNNNHYTCFNAIGTCEKIYYIYYANTEWVNYIELRDGKSVENAIDEMLVSSSNTQDSTIKEYIDDWYESNLISYESSLEDTIWCNDRSITSLGGWNPNGGSTFGNSWTDFSLLFGSHERAYITYLPRITCKSKNDSFTKIETSVGNGKLSNPIGLLTSDEIMMAGGVFDQTNNSYYLYTNHDYWALLPDGFSKDYANEFYVKSTGFSDSIGVDETYGVRPSVSLKLGTLITGGDGTMNKPYTVS